MKENKLASVCVVYMSIIGIQCVCVCVCVSYVYVWSPSKFRKI